MELTTLASRPAADGFWMPAEWAPHEAVWMLWPYRTEIGANPLVRLSATTLRSPTRSAATPVFMGVPEAWIPEAKRILPSAVAIVPMDSDDAGLRDCGPTVVVNDKGERRGVDWISTPGAA